MNNIAGVGATCDHNSMHTTYIPPDNTAKLQGKCPLVGE